MSSDQDEKLPLILTADDDVIIHHIIEALMKKYARVMMVKNTVEAEEAMRQHKPDLVLLDDIMPGGMTGLQFLSHVAKDHDLKDIPIIMVTASNKPEEVLRGLSAGAVDYITKPFKPEELMDAVRKRFEHHTPRICIVVDDADLEEELVDAFTHLQCDVDSIEPSEYNRQDLCERGYDIAILACSAAFQMAQEFHACKKDGICPKLHVVALVEEDVPDQIKERIYFLPSAIPAREILQKVGKLLNPSKS